jgi:hypothetical protein
MRRITVFSLVLLVFAAACKPHSAFEVDAEMINNVPDSIIAVEPMVKIMADVHLAEALGAGKQNGYYPSRYSVKGILPENIRFAWHYLNCLSK